MAGVGRYMAPTDIFQPTLCNFFYKRWPIMFFLTAGEVFLFRCCIKNLQCRSARFFRASSTDVSFRPKLACSHLFGQENISPPRQKKYYSPILIEKNDSRRRPGKTTDRGLKKKLHRMMPIEHFLIDIIQLSFRD